MLYCYSFLYHTNTGKKVFYQRIIPFIFLALNSALKFQGTDIFLQLNTIHFSKNWKCMNTLSYFSLMCREMIFNGLLKNPPHHQLGGQWHGDPTCRKTFFEICLLTSQKYVSQYSHTPKTAICTKPKELSTREQLVFLFDRNKNPLCVYFTFSDPDYVLD